MSIEQEIEIGRADDACAVCALPLSSVPVHKVQHLGRDFVTCSPECLSQFYKNPEAYLTVEEEEE